MCASSALRATLCPRGLGWAGFLTLFVIFFDFSLSTSENGLKKKCREFLPLFDVKMNLKLALRATLF